MQRIHVEKKRRGDLKSLDAVRAAVRGGAHGTRWSAPALTVQTGLPLDEAEWAMLELAGDWPSRLHVRDDGALEIAYTPPDEPSRWRAWLDRHATRLREAGSALTLLLLAPLALMVSLQWVAIAVALPGALQAIVTLVLALPVGVVFCVSLLILVFEVLLLTGVAMVIAGIGFPIGIIWTGSWDEWWLIPLTLVLFGGIGAYVTHMGWIFVSGLLQERGELEAVWSTIADVLFGPRQPRVGPLEDEQRLLAWIARRQGVLSVWELAALLGATPEVANREATRLLVDYGGDVLVTDEGAILYAFDWVGDSALREVQRQGLAGTPDADDPDDDTALDPWLASAAPPALLRSGHAMWLTIVLSGAIVGVVLHPDVLAWPNAAELAQSFRDTDLENDQYGIFLQWFGLWPYALLAAIIALRLPWVALRRRRHAARLRVARLAQRIVEGAGHADVSPDDPLLVTFNGDIDVETGAARFPTAALELEEARRLRRERA